MDANDQVRDIFDAAALQISALDRLLGAAGAAAETVNRRFIRRIAALGVSHWNVGRTTGVVVHLLAGGDGLESWNCRYAAEGYAAHDAVLAYGRGRSGPALMDTVASADPYSQAIDAERQAAGLRGGVIYPFGDGGCATIYGIAQLGLRNPEVVEALALCRWLALCGDFAAARRFNISGLAATEVEAAICRAVLRGDQWAALADAAGMSVSGAREALRRVRAKLAQAGLIDGAAARVDVARRAEDCGLF